MSNLFIFAWAVSLVCVCITIITVAWSRLTSKSYFKVDSHLDRDMLEEYESLCDDDKIVIRAAVKARKA